VEIYRIARNDIGIREEDINDGGGKGALEFGLCHRYVAAGAICACTVHNTWPEITECANGP
jgi:hypothetical protein